MMLTMNKIAGIICQTIEREVDYFTAKKKCYFGFYFLVRVSKTSWFCLCEFIHQYSPCWKPVKLGHLSVLRPRILRLFLTLYGKINSGIIIDRKASCKCQKGNVRYISRNAHNGKTDCKVLPTIWQIWQKSRFCQIESRSWKQEAMRQKRLQKVKTLNFSNFFSFSSLQLNREISVLWTTGSDHCCILFYITTQVILAFWLVLAYDLLEDRRIHDDTARLNFFLILNLNQSHFFAKLSNQSVRFILYRH